MPDVNTLAGKTALITGASAGIGWATALAFAEKGARVVVTARREQRLRELCDLIGARDGKAAYLAGDAADEATAQNCVALAVKQFGRLDILINNAGAGNYKNLVDTSVDEYDALMDSNMKSSFLFTRHAAPVMIAQKGGEILFISSVAGLQGYAGEVVYCASKFAQIGFAQALDGELRKHGIKVGTICPGGVKTEFAVGKGRTEEGVKNSYMMEPHEVADAIVFACMQPRNARILQMTVRHMGEPGR
ncbi:MAG: SDR family oxidoreductase [Acidobacteriaceae bacterium]|jgi:3-oxoacyl-[acyl-carrier protein] reductase